MYHNLKVDFFTIILKDLLLSKKKISQRAEGMHLIVCNRFFKFLSCWVSLRNSWIKCYKIQTLKKGIIGPPLKLSAPAPFPPIFNHLLYPWISNTLTFLMHKNKSRPTFAFSCLTSHFTDIRQIHQTMGSWNYLCCSKVLHNDLDKTSWYLDLTFFKHFRMCVKAGCRASRESAHHCTGPTFHY